MATDRLGLYNVALAAIGERSLDSLTEDGEPRRELDSVWARGNGALRFFLEQGRWKFALRTQKLDSSTIIIPAFGFTFAFEIPTDFVHLDMISAGEHFDMPLMRFEIESGFIFCDIDPLYVRYISDDVAYGADYASWPETFTLWAGHWMATQIGPRLKSDVVMEALEKRARRLLIDARSKDAMQSPTRFPPHGTWVSARYGRYGSHRDRGSRSSLIG